MNSYEPAYLSATNQRPKKQPESWHEPMNNQVRSDVAKRLELLEPTIASQAFLQRTGLGKDLAFHIFAYDAACDPLVAGYIPKLIDSLAARDIRICQINLYQLVLEVLTARGVLQKAFDLEASKGTAAAAKAIGRLIIPSALIDAMKPHLAHPHEVVFVTGVGAVWPLVRSHTILNNLHDVVTNVPLLMFYPGTYSGQGLQLFANLTDDNYYRAFPLLPPEATY
jgi:hypothetical protein